MSGRPFALAVEALLNNGRVRRMCWPQDHFIALARGVLVPPPPWRVPADVAGDTTHNWTPRDAALFMFHPDHTAEGYVPSADDIGAVDWEYA